MTERSCILMHQKISPFAMVGGGGGGSNISRKNRIKSHLIFKVRLKEEEEF